jgi:hypothetical protein
MLLILDVAIGLSFVFLLFSLFTTALNEIVLSMLDQRAEFLRTGLKQILGNHDPTVDAFISHGLIDSFSRNVNGKPAYLPSEAFVAALLDIVNPVAINETTPTLVRTARDVAVALNNAAHPFLSANPKLKTTLKVLFDQAGGDLDKFKKGLESWFNESMDRVSGWYKKRAQMVLFVIALAGALFCNVDAIHIMQGLSSDKSLREGIIGVATEKAKRRVNANGANASDDLGVITKQVKDTLTQLDSLSLPIGWGDAQWNYLFHDIGHPARRRPAHKGDNPEAKPEVKSPPEPTDEKPAAAPTAVKGAAEPAREPTPPKTAKAETISMHGWNWSHILSALVGWFITALAASLGAPFWFETLTRFINIRGNGLKPEDSQKKRASAAAKAATEAKAATADPAED